MSEKKLPFSFSRRAGNLSFLSGQIGLRDGGLVSNNLKEQTIQVMENISEELKKLGLTLKDIVDVSVFMTSVTDYQEFNEIYETFFEEPFPTRTCVMVEGLPFHARVEIKVIAQFPKVSGKVRPYYTARCCE